MVVATLLPARAAHRLAPLPRWAITTRPRPRMVCVCSTDMMYW